jgi:Ca2+-binding RTX toxin-like protein
MSLITGTDNADTLTGTSVDDTIIGAAGGDFIDGGGGFNIAAYWTSPFGIVARLFANSVDNDGFGAQDVLNNISGIAGTAFDDLIYGSDLGNYIQGFSGNDTVFALGGDDLVRVSQGDDFVDGGAGVDRIFFLGKRAEYTVSVNSGGFLIVDNAPDRDGTDAVVNFELFQFTDTQMTAAELTDPNARGDGLPYPRDQASPTEPPPPPPASAPPPGQTFFGGGGDDTLQGGAGNDTIFGGRGIDTAVFSASPTTVTYNPSEGVYVVNGPDGRDILQSVERVRINGAELWIEEAAGLTGWVHRMYNAQNGAHLYTASNTEANVVRSTLANFNHEGLSFKVAPAGAESTQDIFRFYNVQNGAHLYTGSVVERDSVMANLSNMQYEGVAYRAYSRDLGPQEELYRLYNTQNGAHLYTTSEVERDEVLRTLPNFKYEGVAFYVDVL